MSIAFTARRNSLVSLGLLVLLSSLLIGCGQKGGDSASSTPGTNSAPTAPGSPGTPAPARTEFKTGEVVPAGYLGYKVFESWFSTQLQSNGKKGPAGKFLFVDLAIVNTDKKERPVAPLKLVDDAGNEFGLSDKSAQIEQGVGALGKIAPSVSKRAFALFEVPPGHQYKLKIEGFSAGEVVTIDLSPLAAPPKR